MSPELEHEAKADYLWDRSAPVDREVKALENLLGRHAHDGRAFGEDGPPRVRRHGRGWVLLLAAAVLAAAALAYWQIQAGG